MAVAFDASSFGTITSTASVSHTPTGTPRGVIVVVIQDVVATDLVSGVTYGGVTMARVDTTSVSGGSGDVGRTYVYFLGAAIPTGTQNATVTVSSGTDIKAVWVLTVTAAANTEVGTFHNVATSTSLANPSVTVPTDAGFTGLAVGALFSGNTSPNNITAGAGYTLVAGSTANGHDFGSQSAAVEQGAKSGANVAVNFTTAAEDVAMVALAVQEQAGGGGNTYEDAGSGITAATVGTGSDQANFAETGATIEPRVSSATDAVASAELGTGILSAVGSGVAVKVSAEIAKTGAGVSARIGSGTDAVTADESGTAVQARVATGADAVTADESGAAIQPRAAAGTDAVTSVEAGTAITAKVGAGTDATLTVEAGTGILSRVGSGVGSKLGAISKTGAGVRGHVGSATDDTTRSRAGSGIRGHVGSGIALRGATFEKVGAGTTTRAAGGLDAITYSESSTAVTARVVSGGDAVTSTDTGTGIRGHVGSGAKTLLGEVIKSGTGVSARVASGTDVVVIQLPPAGTVTAILVGRVARTKRGSLTNTNRGSVLTG